MLKRSFLILGLIAAFASSGFAATNSNNATVALTATVGSSITLNLSTAAIDFATVTPGNATNAATSTADVTARWRLAPSSTLKVYAYFSGADAMNDGAGSSIPYASFQIQGGDLAALTSVNQTGPFSAGNSSLLFKTVAITGANKTNTTGDVTTLTFNLNLTSQTGLAVGSYTGTLNIQAQATP
jgi:hypothetical protein